MSNKKLIKVAITGNYGSGKSMVGQTIKKMELPFMETDEVVDKLFQTKEMKDIIQDRYQLVAFKKDGAVNKKFLAKMI